jgi:hypothetical protein
MPHLIKESRSICQFDTEEVNGETLYKYSVTQKEFFKLYDKFPIIGEVYDPEDCATVYRVYFHNKTNRLNRCITPEEREEYFTNWEKYLKHSII